MIVAETKMKVIPETCTKCKFSTLIPIVTDWGHYTGMEERICSIINKKVPYEFIKERKNWCYTKCKNCPLKEI